MDFREEDGDLILLHLVSSGVINFLNTQPEGLHLY